MRSFLAAGVDVIAATDHDYVTDYAATVRALGAEDRLLVMGGLETTPLIPFLDVPGEDLPRVIGHFNFWPLTPLPASPRGGAPWDERLEPGELFDLMDPLIGPDGVRMINHPWDEPQFGRDLGYLRAIGFDPRTPLPATAAPPLSARSNVAVVVAAIAVPVWTQVRPQPSWLSRSPCESLLAVPTTGCPAEARANHRSRFFCHSSAPAPLPTSSASQSRLAWPPPGRARSVPPGVASAVAGSGVRGSKPIARR